MEKVRPENSCPPSAVPNKRPLHFNVIASNSGGNLTYELQAANDGSKPYLKENNRIKLPFGPDWYDITFHLVGSASGRMMFDEEEPICAQEGAGCPERGSGVRTNQLRVQPVARKRLVLENRNQEPMEIGYTLFFLDERTGELLPEFDPIMDNGGGGSNVA